MGNLWWRWGVGWAGALQRRVAARRQRDVLFEFVFTSAPDTRSLENDAVEMEKVRPNDMFVRLRDAFPQTVLSLR